MNAASPRRPRGCLPLADCLRDLLAVTGRVPVGIAAHHLPGHRRTFAGRSFGVWQRHHDQQHALRRGHAERGSGT